MENPWQNNPEDDSELPWGDEEEGWEEEEGANPPPWLPSNEDAAYWESEEESADDEPTVQSPYIDFTEIPAWQKSHQFATGVAQFTRLLKEKVQQHPALINLRRQSYLAAVDIAYAHDEGYHPQGIRQGLERCWQSMDRLHQCLALLETLKQIKVLSGISHRKLFNATICARDSLVVWMEELRNFL